jgi:hypothetical protein
MTSHSNRPERPGTQRRRKVSGSAYSNTSQPYRRNGSRSGGTESTSSSSWQRVAGQQKSDQGGPLDGFTFFDFGSSSATTSRSQSSISQFGNQLGISAPQSSLISNNAFPIYDQALSQSAQSNDVFTSHSSPDPATWQPGDVWTPTSSYIGSQADDMIFLDGQSGVCGSIDSFSSSGPNTIESAFSDNVGFIDTSPTWGSPSSSDRMLDDQNIPGTSIETFLGIK